MEFVDNSLDDAEALFNHARGEYSRLVTIDVHVSRDDRTLRIVDDCRGMPPDMLSRVVMRVGESRKRGASFVNGQFGFGMQSFRAACTTLTVTSRSAGERAHRIRVEREQCAGFRLEPVGAAEAPALTADESGAACTGTEVVLAGFDKQWVDESFHAAAVASEIESHFERLLDRRELRVRVWDDDAPDAAPLCCRPIDYQQLCPGASVKLDVDLGHGQTAQCNLCVLPSTGGGLAPKAGGASGTSADVGGFAAGMQAYASRFFVSGRRIASCGATSSFARGSANRWTIWSNPCVVGYIDVRGERGGPLQPVITRDEFKNTRHRAKACESLAHSRPLGYLLT